MRYGFFACLCMASVAALLGLNTPAARADDGLTGNWSGLRTQLDKKGIDLGGSYIGEGLSNVSGGIRRGSVYEGLLELDLGLDLDKLIGLPATIHASAFQIHGHGLTGDYTGNLLPISSIEAFPSTRLNTLWLQVALPDNKGSIRIGKFGADSEFMVSDYAANMINAAWGWMGLPTNELPFAGPVFPVPAPGVRLAVNVTDQVSAKVAVFSGSPLPPSCSDPDFLKCDSSGTRFYVGGGTFVIGEASYAINQGSKSSGLPTTFKVGAWWDSHTSADPTEPGGYDRAHYAIYGMVDRMLWRKPGTDDQGLGAFIRAQWQPESVHKFDYEFDGGLSFKGPLPHRGNDIVTIGANYLDVSNAWRKLNPDAGLSHETLLELSYIAQMTGWWNVQPDVQYIFSPGAQSSVPDALVLGLRSSIQF